MPSLGLIFIDRIKPAKHLGYCESIPPPTLASSPCHPMAPVCWASINLAKLVRHPLRTTLALDMVELDRLVTTAVRLMTTPSICSRFPLVAQAQEAPAKRRIGLGVTGLADA